jgi:hypothetical protein
VSVAIWHGAKGAHLLPKCSTTHPPATRPLNPRSSRLKMRWNLLACVLSCVAAYAPPRRELSEQIGLSNCSGSSSSSFRAGWLCLQLQLSRAWRIFGRIGRGRPLFRTREAIALSPRPACPCQPRRTGGADAAAALVRGEFRERKNPPKTRAESSASS